MTTKAQAIKAVKALGYTVSEGIGESGDGGPGSRLYFRKPDSRAAFDRGWRLESGTDGMGPEEK